VSGFPATDHAMMARALRLAGQGAYTTRPNPMVGCVVAHGEEIVGEGWHRRQGEPHAEVLALLAAGPRARGATVYVTLEPCAHTGRTGPCAEALVEAGVARVVFAQADVNPVAQGGRAALEAAGVDVEAGVLADEAAQVNPTWSFAMLHRRPYVTWKYAATLDGRSAAADGTSQWITSLASRRDVHRLRARCDAIVVGTGTVLADDPWLTVREENGDPAAIQPLRVVVGRSEVPADSRVLDSAAETLLLRTRDPHEVLGELFARDRQHVWLEGGPTLAGAFLRAGVVDEVVAYLAPVLLGDGRHALDDAGVQTLAEAVRLDVTDVSRVGADVRVTGRPLPPRGEEPTTSDKE
jgi:diaminohydroxyphosphoribosylaminopyrimidine deaminase/5-amino-6-(5-phosphoribosylamino)uracil reductase